MTTLGSSFPKEDSDVTVVINRTLFIGTYVCCCNSAFVRMRVEYYEPGWCINWSHSERCGACYGTGIQVQRRVQGDTWILKLLKYYSLFLKKLAKLNDLMNARFNDGNYIYIYITYILSVHVYLYYKLLYLCQVLQECS